MALEARKSTLEFVLVNHPVDCPICDCAGECMLQDHYMEHSARPSRINVRKVHKGKAVVIGKNVVLDKERCINCTRCVRFCKEVSGSGQLVQVHRGNRTEIAVFPGREFDDPYSLCTVDLCPVGALTSRDFRFAIRVWRLSTGDSICPECARGCNLHVDHADGRIYRLRPRFNPEVNKWWACDKGRLSYSQHMGARSTLARIGGFDAVERMGTGVEAAEAAGEEFSRLLGQGSRVATVVAAASSLEEAVAALKFAAGPLGEKEVFLGGRPTAEGDQLLRVADSDANRHGVTRLAQAMGMAVRPVEEIFSGAGLTQVAGVLSVGSDYPFPEPPEGSSLRSAVVLSARCDGVASKATVHIPVPGHFEREGHFVNSSGLVQKADAVMPPHEGSTHVHAVLEVVAGSMGKHWEVLGLDELRSAALEALAEGEVDRA